MTLKVFVRNLIKSFGLKRKLSALFQTVASLIAVVPVLTPWGASLGAIAAWLGVGGIVHATVAGTLGKAPLATIAAFFNALALAAKSVPQLQAWEPVIILVSQILSFVASGFIFGQKLFR